MEVTVVMLDNGMDLFVDAPLANTAKEFDSQLFKNCMMRLKTIDYGDMYIEPAKVVGLRRGVYTPKEEAHDSD